MRSATLLLLATMACGPVHTQGGVLSGAPKSGNSQASAAQSRWQEKLRPLVGQNGEAVQKALGKPVKTTQDGTMTVWWYEDQTPEYRGTINLFFHEDLLRTFEVHVF